MTIAARAFAAAPIGHFLNAESRAGQRFPQPAE